MSSTEYFFPILFASVAVMSRDCYF